MGGTDLDGVPTIVACGVLPRDAVSGFPAEYGTAVIENSLLLLATVTTTDDLIAAGQTP